MPSSWLKVRSRGLSIVWKLYEVPVRGLSVAAEADPARVTAPAASRPDATVAAATRAAFLLMDFISVNPFVMCRDSSGVPFVNQEMRALWAKLRGTGGNAGTRPLPPPPPRRAPRRPAPRPPAAPPPAPAPPPPRTPAPPHPRTPVPPHAVPAPSR